MDLTYINDNKHHTHYDKRERPIIDILNLSQGQVCFSETFYSKVIFVTSGILSISYNKVSDEKLPKGTIMLLTAGRTFNIYAKEATTIIMVYLQYLPNNGDQLLYQQLFQDILSEIHNATDFSMQVRNKSSKRNYYLTIKNSLWPYLENLNERIKDGLNSNTFFELKLQELFLLLRAYYSKEELFSFFSPIQDYEQDFYSIIINNFEKAKTIKELADLTNYSISGFEKKFKRAFKTSAGSWLKQQKSIAIFNEISNENNSFKDICYQNGFSSLSNFNNYCKLHFGQTPGEIRRNGKKKSNMGGICKHYGGF